MADWRRLAFALVALVTVAAAGTVGYIVLGFGVLDAVYQTVTTVTTVGFREVHPLSTAGKVFTIVLILLGVGTALYTLGVLIETLLEGQLPEVFGRRRMERKIAACTTTSWCAGGGGSARRSRSDIVAMGAAAVVVDNDPSRLEGVPHPVVVGDATDDDVLERAGVRRAARSSRRSTPTPATSS